MPSRANVEAGEKIYEIIKNSSEEDLIIVCFRRRLRSYAIRRMNADKAPPL